MLEDDFANPESPYQLTIQRAEELRYVLIARKRHWHCFPMNLVSFELDN